MDDQLIRSTGVIRRDVAGETFLVPVRGRLADLQELFVLNEAGAWVWDRLERPSALSEVVTELAAEFEIAEQQARQDVREFVRQLADAGLVEKAAGERT